MAGTGTSTTDAFPVVWDSRADAELCWLFDIEHTPDVITPLGYDLYFGPFLNGFGWLRACLQNYYVYNWWPADIEQRASSSVDTAQLVDLARHFWDKIVPEVEGYTQRFLTTDFDALADDELATEVEKLPALRTRSGLLHTQALFPYHVGMSHLIATYKDIAADDELAATRLVQGHGCRSVDAGRALWQLSRLAASLPAVRDRLLQVDSATAGDCFAGLQGDPTARPFMKALAAFLDQYGWRTDLFEFAAPTWAEDPQIPLCQLRVYLEMPDYNPDAEQQRQVAERDAAIAEALSGLSSPDAERLRAAIDGASHVVSLQEDHNFYIDQRGAFSPRRLVLAAARRLVSNGLLAEANDVFYLRSGDLLAALGGTSRDAQSTADRTKAGMARWASVTPPQTIGAPPTEEQATAPTFIDGGSQQLSGSGASSGLARGPARVLMSLSEADRLRPGDVLVARTTMPAWTPLFAAACAVITETGGVLSHAAVVAREYGIPAVLNVVDATRLIRDGQPIEVDGSQGIVRLLA